MRLASSNVRRVVLQPVQRLQRSGKALHLLEAGKVPEQGQRQLQNQRFVVHTDGRHASSLPPGMVMVTVVPFQGSLSMRMVP